MDQQPPVQPRTLQVDLLDLEATRKAAEEIGPVDTLMHTAALAHDERLPREQSRTSINTRITENLLEVFAEQDPHLIFLSSVAVYGEDKRREAVHVYEELRPATDYGRSKLLCEQRILSSKLTRCDILRLAPVFDDEHRRDIRKRVFLPGVPGVKIHIRPAPRYSLCHADTVVQAVLDLVAGAGEGRRVSNVADPVPYDQRQLASWFPGRAIPLPVGLISPLYWSTVLLPRSRGYAVRCLFWKLLRSNTYAIDPPWEPTSS